MIPIKDLFIVASIATLLLVGVGITLRSGLAAAGRYRGSQILGNLSRMFMNLVSYAAIFSFVQQWVGFKISFLP